MDVTHDDAKGELAPSGRASGGTGAATDGDGGEVLAGEDEELAGDARDRGAPVGERTRLAAARNL